MRHIGEYDHLNDDDPIEIPLQIDELAKLIVEKNYGTHRFLSALVRARKMSPKHQVHDHDDVLADEIEKLLNSGLF